MAKNSFFSKLTGWLQSTEMFERPSRNIPGNWELFEYYIDTEKELLNFDDEHLKNNSQFLRLDLNEQNNYTISSNLSVSLFRTLDKGNWNISKNYITFIHPDNFRNSVEFQFAFEKGNLKLLKKDTLGKIEFFGFFRRLED
ncbi:MAG: hypothetical protein ABFS16_12680 [Bacteroidota bacterium]